MSNECDVTSISTFGTIPTDAHYVRTSFQRFLSNPPLSSFKKLIVSTPRLLRNLHTMSPAKAAPDVLQESRAQENGFTRTPPIPHVPETKVRSHEFLYGTLVREKRSRRKGVLGPHTRNLPNLMPVALRSRKSCETMVGARTSAQLPCATNASRDEKASHHEKQAAGCADASRESRR